MRGEYEHDAPTIHLNGTSRDDLLNEIDNAYHLLNDAYDALKRTAPNSRDYYPQGANAMAAAEREHMGRMLKVDDVRRELQQLAEAILNS